MKSKPHTGDSTSFQHSVMMHTMHCGLAIHGVSIHSKMTVDNGVVVHHTVQNDSSNHTKHYYKDIDTIPDHHLELDTVSYVLNHNDNTISVGNYVPTRPNKRRRNGYYYWDVVYLTELGYCLFYRGSMLDF